METSLTLGRLVRNLLLLAGLGFVAVLFAKPLLTAAVVVLAFALVGFLLWLPVHSLVLSQKAPLRHSFDCGRTVTARTLAGLGVAWQWAAEGAISLGPALLEIGSGALLGGLLTWVYENAQPESEAVPVGVLAGAVAGVLVVLARRQPTVDEEA